MKLVEVGPVTEEQFDALIDSGDYEREPELIDGHVEWRDAEVPTRDHAAWVTAIIVWFAIHCDVWNINAYAELRTKPAPSNSYLPDVTVLSLDAPHEQIVTHAPLAVFEVLSPRQSMTILRAKFVRYEQMGIKQIWFIDPENGSWNQYIDGQLWMSESFTGVGTIPPFSMLEVSKLVR
jgi:Uma2 family endonuclease